VAVDLNADVGEGFADDVRLLDVVTSANVACGFHAGSVETMRMVCAEAAARGVAVGAHPSFRDRAGFGRRDLDVPLDALREDVAGQIADACVERCQLGSLGGMRGPRRLQRCGIAGSGDGGERRIDGRRDRFLGDLGSVWHESQA